MAKLNYVKSARSSKTVRRCYRTGCGHVVQAGEPYKHASFKTGPYSSTTRVWCKDHSPRASEMTVNDRLSTLYGIQESVEDDLAKLMAGELTITDIKSALESAAEDARGVAEDYETSISNMPDQLQQSSQAEDMQSRADAINEWADALEEVAANLDDEDDFDPDKCAECEGDRDGSQHDEDSEEFDHDFDEPTRETDALAEVESQVSDVVGQLSI